MDRRKFLGKTAVSAAAMGIWPNLSRSASFLGRTLPNDQFIGGGKYIDQNESDAVRFVLASSKTDGDGPQLYPVDFFPHGIAIDPVDPYRLVVFEKKGEGACEIDLRLSSSAKLISPKQGHLFYGHGVFSVDGSLLYATETNVTNQTGVITVRNGKTLDLIDEFPSYGENPHECILFGHGQKMAITNAGGVVDSNYFPSVTYVDTASGKLLETITLENQNLNTGHLALSDDLDIVIVSAPRDGLPTTDNGGVSIRPIGRNLKTMDAPSNIVGNLEGESLSVAIHEETKTVAVTNPDANLITFWNLEKQEFLTSLSCDQPRGVALSIDEKYFVFSYGVETNLLWIAADTLIPEATPLPSPSYISGSHIVNWSREVHRLKQPS